MRIANALVLVLAGILSTAGAASAQEAPPLRWPEVCTLLAVDHDDPIAIARRRGIVDRFDARVEEDLAGLRLHPKTITALLELARRGARHGKGPGKEDHDAVAATTFFFAGQLRREALRDGGRFRVWHDLYEWPIEVSYRVLDLPRRALAERPGLELAGLLELRLAELERTELRGWSRRRVGPIAALDQLGIHAVYEDLRDDDHPRTYCLTWFARADRIVSFVTRLDERRGRPGHDALVAEMTTLLSDHAAGRFPPDRVETLRARRERAHWLVLDAEGRAGTWRVGEEIAPFGPAGYDRITSGTADWLAFASRGARIDGFVLGASGPRPEPVQTLAGPIRSLERSPLSDELECTIDLGPAGRLFATIRPGDDKPRREVGLGVGPGAALPRGGPEFPFALMSDRERLVRPADLLALGGTAVDVAAARLDPEAADGADRAVLVRFRFAEAKRDRLDLYSVAFNGTIKRELWSGTLAREAEGPLVLRLAHSGRELYLLAPEYGLAAISLSGGLPLRLMPPGTLRDVVPLF
ncbi:MAG: hypothetical protein R3F20_12630 [Planctomycetota bacterium]